MAPVLPCVYLSVLVKNFRALTKIIEVSNLFTAIMYVHMRIEFMYVKLCYLDSGTLVVPRVCAQVSNSAIIYKNLP